MYYTIKTELCLPAEERYFLEYYRLKNDLIMPKMMGTQPLFFKEIMLLGKKWESSGNH